MHKQYCSEDDDSDLSDPEEPSGGGEKKKNGVDKSSSCCKSHDFRELDEARWWMLVLIQRTLGRNYTDLSINFRCYIIIMMVFIKQGMNFPLWMNIPL